MGVFQIDPGSVVIHLSCEVSRAGTALTSEFPHERIFPKCSPVRRDRSAREIMCHQSHVLVRQPPVKKRVSSATTEGEILANMHVFSKQDARTLIKFMMPTGGLVLLLTLREARRQGLTYLAIYTLERTVRESREWLGEGLAVSSLRSETGLSQFEISRACTLLKKADLVTVEKAAEDSRERVLVATKRGRRTLEGIISAAANQLWEGLPSFARDRRVSETAELLRQANNRLLGPMQMTFFDTDSASTKRPPKSKRRKRTGER